MIPTDRFFDNKNEIIYDGKLYSRLYRVIDSRAGTFFVLSSYLQIRIMNSA